MIEGDKKVVKNDTDVKTDQQLIEIVDNSHKSIADIKIMVVSETQQQRTAFGDTVRSWGMNLVDCVSRQQVTQKHYDAKADVWLVDSDYDQHMLNAMDNAKANVVLVGFNPAPFLNETQRYAKWQRKLKRKLAQMLDLPELIEDKRFESQERTWAYVVFLGASMGGPSAIKTFLDNVSTELPICILLAHHFNSKMIHTLPRILNRHNDWNCQVISTTQMLQPGRCLIAPIDKKIICDSNGRVILTKEDWHGGYKPAIGELLKNASDVFGSQLITIIFSGMGDDGSQYLQEIQPNNSQLWVQDPKDSACASQPQAIINSGFSHYCGTPEMLAQKLTEYVLSAQPQLQ